MKPKKSPEPPFEPFVRPPGIEAIRNEIRSDLPGWDDGDDLINDEDLVDEAAGFMPQTIRIDENGLRKIVTPSGAEYDYLEDDDTDDEPEIQESDEPAGYEYDTSGAFTIRSGADWYAQNDDDLPPEAQLFGDLWMQNDLCIMFADTNAGKSILAVQIADSISRGLPIPGIGCTAEPAPVLYFDFELSDHQFRSRYSSAETGKFPFTAGFFRATLNPHSPKQRRFDTFEEFISNEIENALLACKAKTLIIDNISCLRYGTHNTAGALNLMQYLQGIKRTYQVSILVLAHTPKRNPAKPISRNDLQGSKMLINLADSAFAIGESLQQPGLKYLKQVKQRGAPETHGADNVCLGRITRTGSFMHFTFSGSGHESDHLAPQTEQYRRATEQRIGELRRQGHSVRRIAAQLGLAPTTIFRALKKLEKCGQEEEGCSDMQLCEYADEEKAPSKGCHTEAQAYPGVTQREVRPKPLPPYEAQSYDDQNAKAPARASGSPLEKGRGVFSKPETPYEAQTHDNLNAASKICHTEAQASPEVTRREVRPKPVPPHEAKTYDDHNAASKICHTEAQACPEVTRREVRPKPVPPYEAKTHDDHNAPSKNCHAETQAFPGVTRREVRPKPVPKYEAKTHDDHNAPSKNCHAETQAFPGVTRREVRPKPVPKYEAQTDDNQNAKAPAPASGSPLERGRGVFSKPETQYEAKTHDDQTALTQICHTEALEVRRKPVTSYEPQIYDDHNAASKICHTEALEVRPKPVPPYEAQIHGDHTANAPRTAT